jgi:hypothetical protein
MNEENKIHKNLSTHQIDNDVVIDSFSPMLDTLQNMNRKNPADSTCTRFIRRKFFCIVVFFLSAIMAMNFLSTVLEKLSQDDVQQIYRSMTQLIKKIPFTNMKNITVENLYNKI